ncbi:UPF0481 protein At3g47200-like [Solanum dulcamara]|uniref:UPF0481 protein At3g47200-like n=1 Tax=Solanum dulcamara TaxID=45834 RepID=UPI0024854F2B|nr:UPF0481 protein At3g47200-like [Solanum dulcamara]
MSQGKMKEDDISYANVKRNDHVLLDIVKEEEEDLVQSIDEKMKNISSFHRINRVPKELRKGSEYSYSPKLVSIGPFHHGVDNLKTMEEYKWCYLNTLVSRKTINTQTILENCVKTLRNLEDKARKCYGENTIDQIGSNEFVQMMLLDSGFLIEVFIKFALKGFRRRDDTLFSNYEKFYHLRCDLILFENQIPFFILHQMFHLVPIPKECTYSLIQLALLFFRKLIPGEGLVTIGKFGPNVHHLLDLIHHCYLPTSPQIHSNGTEKHMYNVLHLHDIGIKFKKAISDSVMNVRFTKDKVLEIPLLKLHNYSEILFKNMVAMEQCDTFKSGTKHVTSYVYLMKSLVRSADDASYLRQREILNSSLYNDEEIFQLMLRLHVEHFDVMDFYYSGLCEKVDGYKNKTKWKECCQKISYVYKKTAKRISC